MGRARIFMAMLFAAPVTAACGSERPARPGPAASAQDPVWLPTTPLVEQTPATPHPVDCTSPRIGCRCDDAVDARVECHSDGLVEDQHGRLRCLVGERACQDGAWGPCVFTSSYELPRPGPRALIDPPAACGNCDPECYEIADNYTLDPGDLSGSGTGIVWDGGAGGIVMSAGGGSLSGAYAWVALLVNDGEVAKIRTADGAEVGRYLVGEDGISNEPSRTAVDGFGDAYVASRAIDGDYFGTDGSGNWATITKIAADLARCRNGGASTSNNDVALAPRGSDDCVLWTARVGVAAGAHIRGLAVDRGDAATAPAGRPWVGAFQNTDGGTSAGRVFQLDPDDGTILRTIPVPIHPYGAAADARDPQRIWFTSHFTGGLVAVRVDNGAVEGPFYPSYPNCAGKTATYAIAVDGSGRVWRPNASVWGVCGDWVTSYLLETNEWRYLNVPNYGVGLTVRLNSDGSNSVFIAARGVNRMAYWDADAPAVATNTLANYCTDFRQGGALSRTQKDDGCGATVNETRSLNIINPAVVTEVAMPVGSPEPYGMCPDADNRIWSVNGKGNGDDISVYDPDTGTTVVYPSSGSILNAYTYSDFTGYQRSAFASLGTAEYFRDYGVLQPACTGATMPVWGDLSWTALTVNSRIRFFAQVAQDVASLAAAPRIALGATDTDPSPIYVDDFLALSERHSPYMRIVAVLESLDGATSPVLGSLGLDWVCFDAE